VIWALSDERELGPHTERGIFDSKLVFEPADGSCESGIQIQMEVKMQIEIKMQM